MFSYIAGDKKKRKVTFASNALEFENSCYLEVEEKHRIDALCHVVSAMRPGRVDIVARDMKKSELERLRDLFADVHIQVDRKQNHDVVYTFNLGHRFFRRVPEKTLRILLDITLPVEKLVDEETFNVLLLPIPTERTISIPKVPELSPVSFVSLYQGK